MITNFSILLLALLYTSNLPSIFLGKAHIHNSLKTNYSLASNKNKSPELFPTIENEGFVFQVTKCRRISQKSTKCDLLIENKIHERTLTIYGRNRTRIIDTSGNEALASKVSIGRKTGSSYVSGKLLRNVPIKASVVFDGLITHTDNISVIDISSQLRDGRSRRMFEVQIELQNVDARN